MRIKQFHKPISESSDQLHRVAYVAGELVYGHKKGKSYAFKPEEDNQQFKSLVAKMLEKNGYAKLAQQLLAQQDVAEDLDGNQKRVGQLGPTEKVGKQGPIGKLVGVSEGELTEEQLLAKKLMDEWLKSKDEKPADRELSKKPRDKDIVPLDEISKETIKSYFPKRVQSAKKIARQDFDKAKRITTTDLPRALSKLKDPKYDQKAKK